MSLSESACSLLPDSKSLSRRLPILVAGENTRDSGTTQSLKKKKKKNKQTKLCKGCFYFRQAREIAKQERGNISGKKNNNNKVNISSKTKYLRENCEETRFFRELLNQISH